MEVPTKTKAKITKRFVEEELSRTIFNNSKFENPWETWIERTFNDVTKAFFRSGATAVRPSKEELDEKLPVVEISQEDLLNPPEDCIQTVWIGHSSFLVQLDGINFLTDPVWCERASPFQFVGPLRMRKVPIALDALPPIDFVVISHNHYDHLDSSVVSKLGSKTTWIVPKELGAWFRSFNIDHDKIIELEWWEQWSYNEKIHITCTPCQHWSKRTLMDDRTTLWNSYIIEGTKQKVYFAGDTGYCSVFKEIGRILGPVDLCLIPIGAYEPRWFMKPQHVDPDEAVQMHIDLKSKKSIGMHWGTFILTQEPVFEPPERLQSALKNNNLNDDEFITLNIGQIHRIPLNQ